MLTLAFLVDEMKSNTIDVSAEVAEAVQEAFLFPPVEVPLPIVAQLPEV